MGDQPWWGARIYEHGIGPAPIPASKLSPENLSEAIQTAIHDLPMSAWLPRLESRSGKRRAWRTPSILSSGWLAHRGKPTAIEKGVYPEIMPICHGIADKGFFSSGMIGRLSIAPNKAQNQHPSAFKLWRKDEG
jgi:hypothetical protein